MIQGQQALFSAPDISLPKIDKTLARLWAQLARRDIKGQIDLGGHLWTYAQREELSDGIGAGTVVEMLVNGELISACLTTKITDWIEELSDFFEPYEKVTPERLALILEHVLTKEIEALEAAWDAKIELRAVRLVSKFDMGKQLCSLDVAGDARRAKFTVHLDAKNRENLANILSSAFAEREKRTLRHLKIGLRLYGPIATLSAKYLSQMREGSVFFPHVDWRSNNPAVWYIGWSHYIARASVAKNGFAIEGLEENFEVFLREHTQGGAKMQGGDGNSGGVAGATAVVTVELGRQDMSISEIEGLRQGSVVEFDIDRVEEVVLSASGQPVAQGRLVQLDDTIGVQITRLL